MSSPLELFRRLTNGVHVVGVAHAGKRDAFTAAWITQVSFDPLLLMLSINPEHYSYPLLTGARGFAVTILGEGQLDLVRHFADKKKPIAAICHGAQILTAADVVRGRSLSAYPACAPEVRAAGGEYVDVPMDGAHVDGNLVTAPAWPAHPAWLAKFLTVLGTKITA